MAIDATPTTSKRRLSTSSSSSSSSSSCSSDDDVLLPPSAKPVDHGADVSDDSPPINPFEELDQTISRNAEQARQLRDSRKMMGIPVWMQRPETFASAVSTTANTSIDDDDIQLSENTKTQLLANGIKRLFPVQSAVLKTVLSTRKEEANVVDKSVVDDVMKTMEEFFQKNKDEFAEFMTDDSDDDKLLSSHPQPIWKAVFDQTEDNHHDLVVCAPTGSGKTLSYVLPIIETLAHRDTTLLRAVIVVPTRDLVRQVTKTFQDFATGTDLKIVGVVGGKGTVSSFDDVDMEEVNEFGGNGAWRKEQEQLCWSFDARTGQGTYPFLFRTLTHHEWEKFAPFHYGDGVFKPQVNNEEDIYFHGGLTKIDILVTTPGRLIDHIQQTPGFTLQHLHFLVLDEVDRLLGQGFHEWMERVLKSTVLDVNPKRGRDADGKWKWPYDPVTKLSFPDIITTRPSDQYKLDDYVAFGDAFDSMEPEHVLGSPVRLRKMLFSATISKNPEKLAMLKLYNPLYLRADIEEQELMQENAPMNDKEAFMLPEKLRQHFLITENPSDKPLYVLYLLYKYKLASTLCFTNTLETTDRLYRVINAYCEQNPVIIKGREFRFKTAYYSANLHISERKKILKSFSNGEINLLITTDALARGVDLTSDTQQGAKGIINYTHPPAIQTYVHRIGRTARAGQEGIAYSVLASHEVRHFKKSMRDAALYDKLEKMKVDEDSKLYRNMIESFKECLESMRVE